jgi:hypothetical protein
MRIKQMMKKLFLITVTILGLASCASDNTYQVQQAQIDSAVNANVARHDAENTIKKDSTLRAIEKQKADSITAQTELERKKQAPPKEGRP